MATEPQADPVGIREVAERLKLSPQTVTNLRYQATHGTGGPHPFPPQRWTVAGKVPLWDWDADIVPWGEATGRIAGERTAPKRRRAKAPSEPQPVPEPTVVELPVVRLVITRDRPRLIHFELRWGDRVHRWPNHVPTLGTAERKSREWLDEQLGQDAYRLEMP